MIAGAGLLVVALVLIEAAGGRFYENLGGRSVGQRAETGRVVRVVDGDTVHVRRTRGDTITVRLALVDAPEQSATRYGYAECGGRQATAFLRRCAHGTVTLRRPGGEDRDRHGRHVRELVQNGRSVDEQLVAAGWAKPYRVPARAGGAAANDRVQRAAAAARREGRGVWRACGGFGRPAR